MHIYGRKKKRNMRVVKNKLVSKDYTPNRKQKIVNASTLYMFNKVWQ
jgi:hypothetical protein